MAIQTINATILMRGGAEADFDPDQMSAREWAVSTDTKKVWMCFKPGIVLRMATYEGFEADMVEIQTILSECQDIKLAVERFEQLAEQHESQAEEWSIASKSWAVGDTGTRDGEDTNNSKYWSQQSKSEADRAKSEADRAASIVGFSVDDALSETSINPVQNKVITEALSGKIATDGDASLATVTFSRAAALANIQSGDSMATALGKLSKLYAELEGGGMSYWALKGGIEIPANADLNNCAKIGNYYCSSNTNAATLSNCPITNAFIMKVFYSNGGGTHITQQLHQYSTGTIYLRIKTVSFGTWTAWRLLTPTLANNLTTTTEGSALDARQGKVMNDKITELNGNIGKTIMMKGIAGNLSDTTYGNGWYYFTDKSINTPETYGICFVLKMNNWSFRLAIGTTGFVYTNVNIGQGFGTWRKL